MVTKEEILSRYKYYKAEKECPFPADSGKAFWWKVESYAFERHDEKFPEELSFTMIEYIKGRQWESESGCNTTWEEAYRRALELYKKGLWCGSYISNINTTIEYAH